MNQKKYLRSQILDEDNENNEEIILRKKKNRTILEDMQLLMIGLKEEGLSTKFLSEYEEFTINICKKYKIKPMEAIFLTLCAEKSDESCIDLDDFNRILSCGRIKLIGWLKYLESLCDKRLLWRVENRLLYKESFRMPKEVMLAIVHNKPYQPTNYKNLDIHHFFYTMGEIFNMKEENRYLEEISMELKLLLAENEKLHFVTLLRSLKLDDAHLIPFLFFCHSLINLGEEDVCVNDIEKITSRAHKLAIRCGFGRKANVLFEKELIELSSLENLFGKKEYYRLTEKVQKEFLHEVYAAPEIKKDRGIIDSNSIKEKQLFYNKKEELQISKLLQVLQPDEFAKIHDRLTNAHLRIGFACLFYGSPGTGKTETVLQLAKQSGRDIFQVNISEMKSMWFGESEKIIQGLFDQYAKMVKKEKVAPILLFNEADAVFSKRKDVANGNLAKTENAMQNIILQELEKLEGILIATTNLTENLDKAFERRFLYKIRFEQPSVEAKKSIWRLMLNEITSVVLSDEAYCQLAESFDFSGGQIENVARKCQIEHILNGKALDFKEIKQFCDEELLIKNEEIKPIGFCRN